jgi:hypothetical protein
VVDSHFLEHLIVSLSVEGYEGKDSGNGDGNQKDFSH